ncbi:unnamed protein product, partial [Iphiclides podalirius]
MDGAHVSDIQAKSTESSEPTSLITANNTRCTKSDTVRKRLLTSPTSVIQNGNQSIQCSSKAKKRKSSICKDDKYIAKAEDNSNEDDIEEEKEIFALLVSNIPFQWTSEQITEFIQDHKIDVYAIEYLDGGDPDFGQRLRLSFLSFEKCNEARKKLKLKMVKGRKLSVAFIVPEDSDSDIDSKTSLLIDKSECKPATTPSPLPLEVDVAPDPEGFYGLRADYLESLGIRPPIDRWVHVSNFRCDKSELKEVLELAGQVVICNVIMTRERYSKVMYSHPLEAVQAVSMLNGRLLYGQVLKVSMYQCPHEVILPKGLADVGPGLGEGGRPLRDIAKEYARHIMGGHSAVDRSIFVERGGGQSRTPIKGNPTKQPRPPSSESAPGYPNPSNVPITNSTGPYQSGRAPGAERFEPPVPNRPQTVVRLSGGDVGHQSCPVPGLRGPGIFNPGAVRHQTPPANPGMAANTWASYVAPNLNNRPVDRLAQQCKGPTATVELSNLPLSTTFPLLSEKMAQVGQVMSLELTRAGCALVRFANPAQAQRCYQHFNKMCAMGNTIEVRFV